MIILATPADPSGIPLNAYGPYTFIVVIAWLLLYASKEYRKGRAEEVEAYKSRAIEEKARADTLAVDSGRTVAGLKDDLANLQVEVENLRDSHINETARAHAKTERWMQGYFYLRTMLIEQGLDPGPPPEDPSSVVDAALPEEKP